MLIKHLLSIYGGMLGGILAIICFFLVIGGVMALFSRYPGTGLICLLIGGSPPTFIIWLDNHKKAKLAAKHTANHTAMLDAAGVSVNTGCDHSEGDTGIAINRSAKTLTLRSEGSWKTYQFSQVMARFRPRGITFSAGSYVNPDIWDLEIKDWETSRQWLKILREVIRVD